MVFIELCKRVRRYFGIRTCCSAVCSLSYDEQYLWQKKCEPRSTAWNDAVAHEHYSTYMLSIFEAKWKTLAFTQLLGS